MSDIVIDTLKRELKKKKTRVDKLEKLMTEKHLDSETAKKMDAYAKRFNDAESGEDKMKVAREWKLTSDKWEKRIERLKHQTKNYVKWMDEQSTLHTECRHLGEEISMREFRKSIRG